MHQAMWYGGPPGLPNSPITTLSPASILPPLNNLLTTTFPPHIKWNYKPPRAPLHGNIARAFKIAVLYILDVYIWFGFGNSRMIISASSTKRYIFFRYFRFGLLPAAIEEERQQLIDTIHRVWRRQKLRFSVSIFLIFSMSSFTSGNFDCSKVFKIYGYFSTGKSPLCFKAVVIWSRFSTATSSETLKTPVFRIAPDKAVEVPLRGLCN